jgi:excinuclease UvrABC ATPase subunit
VVVDRLAASKDKESRLAESLDQAAKLTDGIVTVVGSGKAAGEISERLYNKRRELTEQSPATNAPFTRTAGSGNTRAIVRSTRMRCPAISRREESDQPIMVARSRKSAGASSSSPPLPTSEVWNPATDSGPSSPSWI